LALAFEEDLSTHQSSTLYCDRVRKSLPLLDTGIYELSNELTEVGDGMYHKPYREFGSLWSHRTRGVLPLHSAGLGIRGEGNQRPLQDHRTIGIAAVSIRLG
jgi:hypothetical protein